jgi:Patatin-like phospholipase
MTCNPDENENPFVIPGKSVSLSTVLATEHVQIGEVRKLRLQRSGWKSFEFPVGEPRVKDVATPPKAPTPGREPNEGDAPDWQKDRDQEHREWRQAVCNAHKMNLTGVCFSGGGIRSATFNLGVLQALADLKLLHRFDYLSTVSGGGYIGSWLTAWTKRVGDFGKVQQLLSTDRVHLKDDIESAPIRFLRTYSNYLTPQLGPFSGDTLAMVAIYLRNLLLNQSVIVGLLATLLLVPRVLRPCAAHIRCLHAGTVQGGVIAGGAVLLVIMVLVTTLNLACITLGKAPKWTNRRTVAFLRVFPFFCAALLAGVWLWLGQTEQGFARAVPDWATTSAAIVDRWIFASHARNLTPASRLLLFDAVRGAILYAAIWGCAVLLGSLWPKFILWTMQLEKNGSQADSTHQMAEAVIPKSQDDPQSSWTAWRAVLQFARLPGALATGALAGWLYGLLAHSVHWDAKDAVTFGVPVVVGIVLLAATLHIGLLGTGFEDGKREWWGRLGGWMIAIGIAWLALFWVALYFPGFVEHSTLLRHSVQSLATKYLTPTWIVTTIGSVLAGNSSASGKPGEKSKTETYLDLIAEVGPYVFIVGLVCWMSWGLDQAPFKDWSIGWELGICVAATLLMSWRVDINQFSMHMFYRNRLVGCYLGASNEKRCPNLFTGFDPNDDLALKCFKSPNPEKAAANQLCGNDTEYDGPYPVLNMSLNLVKGKDLAWQERKAESFVMTPHYCGYDVFLEQQYSKMQSDEFKEAYEHKNKTGINKLDLFGYRPTEEYAFPSDEPRYHGPNLGLAMAISGAAASPNMGFYTSMPVAFLLTVFNVRLGQWLGNPRNSRTSRKPTPTVSLECLMQELLAGTNDESKYVYLSDGGHFDNMGLYELVKRRCGLIIVCDAEADPNYGFAGLGNAINKCRIDLGISIEIDTKPIVPNKSGMSKQHYAVGKIHYEQADMDAPVGKIIYIKASLTGGEPTDVTTYKKRHRAFPHESTANQWFTESQFESYRRLGYAALESSVEGKKEHGSGKVKSDIIPILKEFGFEIQEPDVAPASH